MVRHQRQSSLVSFAIGNNDFAKIFGKQEAAERKIRDLAREYHPLTRKVIDELYNANGGEDANTTATDKHLRNTGNENSLETVSKEATTVVVKKTYVPPPHL
jgi:hypothetical protein